MNVAAILVILVAAAAIPAGAGAAGESAESIYMRALARERQLRDSESAATASQLRRVVQMYERVVRTFPRSGYCDNALWQGAHVALLAHERSGEAADRKRAVRLLKHLREEYPTSSLARRAADVMQALDAARAESAAAAEPAAPAADPPPAAAADEPASREPSAAETTGTAAQGPGVVTIRDIRRTPLPDGVRVTIEMEGEALYRSDRLEHPRRVFFDLKGTRAAPPLQDATLRFTDDVVREIRLGRHPQNTTRVVIDMESVEAYSAFTLYNPFRLVVDFRRAGAAANLTDGASRSAAGSSPPAPPPVAGTPRPLPAATDTKPVPLLSRPLPGAGPSSPAAAVANSSGHFSLARQLGLGVSRIVLDAGHGGHDPGARANGVSEAELVLDVTLRLRDLLEKQPGIEVTLTRDKDEFIPLEERTAIANRKSADLFLSIHANASRNPRARGIETYFLNFAMNPEAEEVAARENSASGRTMRNLPDIVKAIALNNKIDESRDFAETVQKAMVRRLTARNRTVRDLGVKQAPFVVLIGAGMPSVLAEISFVTHKQEGALLKTAAYRQQIAEALFDAILRYQRSLKGVRAVAAKE